MQNKQEFRKLSKHSKSYLHSVRKVGSDDLTNFTIVSMVRITGVEISERSNVQNKMQFRRVSKHSKSDIYSGRNIGNDDLNKVHHS